jgi:hypothetical protein
MTPGTPVQPAQVEKVQLTPSPAGQAAVLPEQPPKPTLQPVPPASADTSGQKGHKREGGQKGEDGEEPWDRFLAAVQKTKLSLFFALKSGQLYDLTETVLLIGVNKDPYFKELTRKENKVILEEAAQWVFGRKVSVEITKGPPRTATPSGASGGTGGSGDSGEPGRGNGHSPDTPPDAPPGSPVKTQSQPDNANTNGNRQQPAKATLSEEDPLVKTVLDVLGGEVQSTRIRGATERPQ